MSKKPKFEDRGNHFVLLCPYCKDGHGQYLHHEQVDFYQRKEDAETGLHISASDDGKLSVDHNSSLKGNPSNRRGGIAIQFSCEGCGKISTLTFAQHKGETYVEHG